MGYGILIGLLALLLPSGRSTPAQQPATLSGVVVSADVPAQPVRRAIVTLTGPSLAANLSTVTDEAGRFTFANLEAGRYRVRVSKPAFLTSDYGGLRPGAVGTPVALDAGQEVDTIRLVLERGAVIAGSVREAGGAPAAGVPVYAVPASAGNRAAAQRAITDDRGAYRIYGLPPGDYVVAASASEFFRLFQEAESFPAAEIDRRLDVLQRQRARPGRSPEAPSFETTAPLYAHVAMYFPGTPVAGDASTLHLEAGTERVGIDILLMPVALGTLRGTVLMADGSPLPPVQLTVGLDGPSLVQLGLGARVRTPVMDGTFEYPNARPGRYIVTATVVTGADGADHEGWRGRVEVVVRAGSAANATVILRPLPAISGRIAFDAARLTPPDDLQSVRVRLAGVRTADSAPAGGGVSVPARVDQDATVRWENVPPGRYTVAGVVAGASGPDGWWLRSAILDGRDLLDEALALDENAGDRSGLLLTFTDRHSALTGVLQGADGQPAPAYTVVVFPADRATWQAGSRRLRTTRPASDGVFTLRDLPGGAYRLAALVDVLDEELDDPAFLGQLVPVSIPVTIRDGGVTTQDIRVAR